MVRVLREVMARVSAGELKPIVHSRWPLAEAGAALRFMRSARHLGKIVVTAPPLLNGRLRQDRTYLVTGGLGGIGCAVAEWLADKGAGTIVLNGRRDPDEAAEETINALRERGVTVQVELADVSDAAAVDRMLERMDRELPPLGGVIHSVGVLSDAALTNQNWESFEKVLWPKILGGWHLHRATVDRDLDFFILFSSRVGVMGNPGQANHAAANAFLDQLAGHRRAMGLPAQAIAWGAWSEIGEAAEQKERIERRRAALGGRWFTPQQGLKALENLVRQDATTSVVMSMDWSVFAEAVADRPPLLEDLLSAVAEGKTDAVAASGDLLSRLRQTPAGTHEELLVSFLQREVQAVLRLPSTPAPTVGFFDLGMDSLMAVELRNRLNRAFSDEYTAPNTVVFDYPDIAALARHLVEALGEIGSAPAPQAQPEPLPAVRPEDDGIAIVGMACRFPGAPDLSAFWRLLEAGVNAVTDRRPGTDAWSDLARDIPTGYAAYCRGAFVDEIDKFDAGFFRITPIDARNLDPRHRMLLETSWQALEDAGMDPDRLRGSRTGIYAGIGTSEYRDLMTTTDYGISYLGTAPSMAVGRIAFHLGLEGPTVPVELNCASSLVALHHAVAGLQRGEVNMALVGGASAILSTGIIREMADLGMLSRTGACRTFDASADGFARGEGCGIIVLKRLAEAKADGDRIWGVIRGSAVNQNGASAGPTVPNGPVQERVIEEALSRAGVSPSDVDYLEAHGSASELGDTIEVQSAAAVYGKGRKADHALLIGSVKTNIGHLEPAAGVAGLIKVILAMNQGVIPRHLHFRDPNPNLEWDRLPVRVTSEATDWPVHPDRPPFAAVSAFGISGTNAHVVVEGNGTGDGVGSRHQPAGGAQPVAVDLPEPVKDLPLAKEGLGARKTRFLPLSGKSDGALRELASRYLSWLDEHALSSGDDTDPLLADMAWTAGVGRSHFNHRAGVVFRDAASLREGLRKLETGRQTEPRAPAKVAFAYTGQAGQWAGMGHALYESEPVVRAVLDRCDSVLREAQDDSLLDVLFGQAPGDPNDAARIQPAIYALECALTALWASIGIRPSVVVGHNLGELAAAQAAWMFGLEDGLRFAAARGALIGGLPEVGAQTAALDDLQATLDGIAIAPPSLTLVSSMTGKVVEPGKTLDPAYWRCQASEPTATDRCAETVVDLGVETIVQIGPRTTPASAADNGEAPVVLSCLPGTFVEAVAGAYEAGLPVSFAGLFAGEARRRIALPGYPFQRRRYWIATQNRQ
ncbi:MAG: SDR family NAD(P)-dependent oxidoreductase [Nitrospira sp. SB0672_bin_25]|nr:SDR family NAD(P)-dependent oxidoreductase [Nitrospira sp. SB0672_bin_25]